SHTGPEQSTEVAPRSLGHVSAPGDAQDRVTDLRADVSLTLLLWRQEVGYVPEKRLERLWLLRVVELVEAPLDFFQQSPLVFLLNDPACDQKVVGGGALLDPRFNSRVVHHPSDLDRSIKKRGRAFPETHGSTSSSIVDSSAPVGDAPSNGSSPLKASTTMHSSRSTPSTDINVRWSTITSLIALHWGTENRPTSSR